MKEESPDYEKDSFKACIKPFTEDIPSKGKLQTRVTLRLPFKDLKDIITIKVGSREHTFRLHAELLQQESDFFRAALSGGFANDDDNDGEEGDNFAPRPKIQTRAAFREAISKTVLLPSEEVDMFDLFATWLYTDQLYHPDVEKNPPAYYILLRLYALADRLLADKLRDVIIVRLKERAEETNTAPTPSDTRLLYETTHPESAMRKVIVHLFARKKTETLLSTHKGSWHPEFLRDLVIHLKSDRTWDRDIRKPVGVKSRIKSKYGY